MDYVDAPKGWQPPFATPGHHGPAPYGPCYSCSCGWGRDVIPGVCYYAPSEAEFREHLSAQDEEQ